ncbi:hypothetical protein Tco_1548772 [Tanacetum coccineum]
MVPPNNLRHVINGKDINETQYKVMIGSLMYLTASRPIIQFSTCLYVRYQENPKESHLIVVKRIFKYLKGTLSLGLWYPKCLGFELKGYSDSNYDGCNMDKKSTSSAGKTSRYDQITNKDSIILYCLANAVNIDYVGLIWDDLVSKLKKSKKEKVIPYPRFLSLLLELKMEDMDRIKSP